MSTNAVGNILFDSGAMIVIRFPRVRQLYQQNRVKMNGEKDEKEFSEGDDLVDDPVLDEFGLEEDEFDHEDTDAEHDATENFATDIGTDSGRVEAVLFLAKQPLNTRKIAQLAGVEDGTRARTIVRQLNQKYDEVGRAFQINEVAGGYQLRTRPAFSPWLQRIGRTTQQIRLSGPALETVSIVAYRQPVMKSEIEAIRGVSCGELLKQLLDRGLVKIAGRSEVLGNPYLYATTKKFMEVFGIAQLSRLPRSEKLRGQGLPDWPQQPEAESTKKGQEIT